jgi:hypothetical protein
MTEGTIASSLAVGFGDDAVTHLAPGEGFGIQSRLAIGQLLRSWLDARCLTPTELLHDHQALSSLLAEPRTVETALKPLLSAPGGPATPDTMQAIVDQVLARAAAAAAVLDGLTGAATPLAALRDQGMVPGRSAEQDHLLRAAVCRELAGCRTRVQKLALLVGLVVEDGNGGGDGGTGAGGGMATLVDGVVADLLGAGSVLTELFGPHPYLGVKLRRALDLVLTLLPRPAEVVGTPLFDLNRLLVEQRLPLARAALLDWVRGHLDSPLPLGSGRREEDIRLFHELLAMLATPGGFVGEGAMAEALVARYARRLDQDGGTALQSAIQGIVETLPNLLSRLYFLAAVACSALGRRSVDEVAVLVDAAAHNQTLIESAVFQPFDPPALQAALTRAAAAFDHAGLPEEVSRRVQDRITGLVDAFVMRGNFLELMDASEPSAVRRVQGLAAVIAAGLVTDFGGKPLIRQHMDRLSEPGASLARLAPASRLSPGWRQPPGRDSEIRLISRFGRYRCPYCFEAKRGGVLCLVCGYDETEGARPGVHLAAGTVLQGRYVIGRLIGQGGFGATYLGWDERLQVKVAIKEYFPVSLAGRTEGGTLKPYVAAHVGAFRDGIVKFVEEARTLTRLRYVKEVVEVLDHFEANGTAYLVMELLIGRTLQRHLLEEGGIIDYRRALGLMLPIAKAVHEVHRLGLVHRDISPDNIFLLDCGDAKLLDFGAARHCLGEALGALTVILKRGYAPPEQYVSNGHQGPWTDVYALSATFYCAITGRPPPEATARREAETLVRPSQLGINIPPAVEEVLLDGLALGWQDRPRDMKTLLQAFSRALS